MHINNKHFRYYAASLVLSIIYIVFCELIWLPAPLRTPSGRLWIEMIDGLLYGLAILPLLLAIGASAGTYRLLGALGKKSGAVRWTIAVRGFAFAVNAAAIVLVFLDPQRLLVNLVFIAAGFLVAFIDLMVSELAGKRGWRRFVPVRSLIWLICIAALLGLFVYPTSYRVTYPAMTIAMNRYAHAEGGAAGGSISGVLVFERPAVAADWLYAKLFPLYEFERKRADEPPLTEEYSQVVTMKTNANEVASAIAMQKAGIGEGISSKGVVVLGVAKDGAAKEQLEAGDVIVSLNGEPVLTIEAMTTYMAERVEPGSTVKVGLRRNGEMLVVEAPTGKAEASENLPERAVFGISVGNDLHADIPRKVDYRTYIAHIGGPSHGAMLTLALIDQLTPGGVTGGIRVAGTGTIEADGSIGLVGGVPQKAFAVSRTDADVFFVPAALEQDARSGAPNLQIVPVETIDDVLRWLKQHRGSEGDSSGSSSGA
ncbi:PDZ domain-containing protein [Paenibacillus sp. NEAU-GSW1]|uniref:PDZ domain-containing protein n=1 Tax=Paenibacillus sp. NEAU-GSW1 TaxID=2682486 RepID=UPI0015635367|nr:PDZ domain-containing protein [Paenibacillus sp. NEAU-GSW1]